jgi:hypothetical protein
VFLGVVRVSCWKGYVDFVILRVTRIGSLGSRHLLVAEARYRAQHQSRIPALTYVWYFGAHRTVSKHTRNVTSEYSVSDQAIRRVNFRWLSIAGRRLITRAARCFSVASRQYAYVQSLTLAEVSP